MGRTASRSIAPGALHFVEKCHEAKSERSRLEILRDESVLGPAESDLAYRHPKGRAPIEALAVDLFASLFNAGGDEQIQQPKYRGSFVSVGLLGELPHPAASTSINCIESGRAAIFLLDDAGSFFADARLHSWLRSPSVALELFDGRLDRCSVWDLLHAF